MRGKPRQKRLDRPWTDPRRHRDRESRIAAGGRLRHASGVVGLGEDQSRLVEQSSTGGCQRNLFARAREKGSFEFPLQCGDLLAQGRLRYTKSPRSPAKVHLLSQSDEKPELF